LLDEQQAAGSVQVPTVLPAAAAQHGLPVNPHGRQTLPVGSQARLASPHLLPIVQQGWPAPPHFKHWYDAVAVVVQMVVGSRHDPTKLPVLVGQQG
jgi:hypothetical protein